ncbi:hypothetical protein LFT44_16685 [Arthrobacter sp. FW306-05-C]|uniref:hypothetical protein n=1 Tax=Arthrobacter sp. FW306-05-C TaxID=2879620 RepID=UPI001F1DAFC1|nr:hypothetical protein [Arthrobacter sp. FW306-05-C]UKA66114.1 hypothetical protein LFT44_16685 [Arthrobacter sp. FW306-05-C]
MIREIRHERYAEWADEVLSVANKVLQDWPSEPSSDEQDFFPSIAHSICISHTERLKAAVTLYRAGLGNHAAPFVRIAYEENTWIHYLATLEDRRLRNELLSRMANLNVMQRVRTQSTFFGQDEAKATGFLESAHNELAPQFEQNLRSFEELATKLSWPSRRARGGYPGALPKIAWLAEKRFAEKHPLHGFLAECSSQYVHFSAYQTMRGVTKGLDGSASYSDEFQRGIDSGFALGWLTELLIDCFIPSRTWVSPELDFEDQWLRHWPTHMLRIQRDLGAYGLPALMYAADLIRPQK